jgi:biotin carboxyl carrier protein
MADLTTDEQARATIARLAEEMLPTLMDRLARSELGELEVRQDGWRIRLRRPLAIAPPDEPAAGNGSRPAAIGGEATRVVATGAAVHAGPERGARPEPRPDVVSSPAVGYFMPRDGVAVGASLRSGDLIGYIDVLGVRHEIVSPRDGTLREIEVEPGAAVEYGEPIARVEAHV